jgi:hypothetical protein
MPKSVVLVEWNDACFCKDEPPLPLVVQTIGWLVVETPEYITLAMEARVKDGEFRDFVTIPRAYITTITRLRKTGKH